MTRTEKLVTAIVLSVNLSVGYFLISRSDFTSLVKGHAPQPAEVAALSPAPGLLDAPLTAQNE
ncbi:MAG: hypothetical protein R3F49_07340 [Planctomycetota bacterium]